MARDPLSIAYYSPGWPPGRVANGIVTYIGRMCEPIRAQGNHLSVLTECEGVDAAGQDVASLSRTKPTMFLMIARRLLLRRNTTWICVQIGARVASELSSRPAAGAIDILEIEETFGTPLVIRRLVGTPIVARLHGPWLLNGAALGVPIDAEFNRRIRLEKRGILSADGVTSPSRDVLETVRRAYGIPLPNAAVIPNPTLEVPEASRWAWQDSRHPTVLFVGRFDRHKGGDVVVDAFGEILKAFPAARLVFVGPDTGVRLAGGAVMNIEGYLHERLPAGARKHVEVMGRMNAEDIARLRRQSSVTVVASRYENSSYTLLEALSCGCPTVATRVGGNPEILSDGETGLLCSPDDPGSLAAKVKELLGNPRRAADLGHAAAIDVSRRFSPATVADRTLEYYREVLERTSHRERRSPLGRALPLLVHRSRQVSPGGPSAPWEQAC
jgi:glycosyltransferase involved in cell wall biosynthesis